MAMVGQEDKRHVIVLVSSSSTSDILPFQVIFTNCTKMCLFPINRCRKLYEDVDFHLTNSSKH